MDQPMPDEPPFDPTETQRYREPVSAGNRDLLLNMNERLVLLETQFVDLREAVVDLKEVVSSKFDTLDKTIRWAVVALAQAPISITGILVTSGFLYLGKIQTWECGLACAVLLYPLYGEGILALIGKIKGK